MVPRAPAHAGSACRPHPFLCAERFTTADVAVGYALMLAELFGLTNVSRPPSLRLLAAPVVRADVSARAGGAGNRAARGRGVSPDLRPNRPAIWLIGKV